MESMDEINPHEDKLIIFGMRGHWDVWIGIQERIDGRLSVTSKIIDTGRHSMKNQSFYQKVWDDSLTRVGGDILPLFKQYRDLVYIHTGFQL